MASLLFPAFVGKPVVQFRWAYATVLTDIVRACTGSIEALTLFRSLLLGEDGGPDSIGFMGFDAHGGDTGCQLRAGMVLEVFSVHRRLMTDPQTKLLRKVEWIDIYLERLEKVLGAARDACKRLTIDRHMPKALGFNDKQDTASAILRALGWDETYDGPLYGEPMPEYPSGEVASVDNYGSAESNSETPSSVHLESNTQIVQGSDDAKESSNLNIQDKTLRVQAALNRLLLDNNQEDKACLNVPGQDQADKRPETLRQLSYTSSVVSYANSDISAEESVASSASSVSDLSMDDGPSALQTRWKVHDAPTMVRFLTYCHTLSKYKDFCRLKNVVGARVCPELAQEAGNAMIEPYINRKNTDYKPINIKRYRAEFETYQSWLSDFSCAWLYSLANRSGAKQNLSSLMSQTIQKSAKGLTAMACFPGYLLLREAWAKEQCQMILVDRHYCPHGYHINLYYAQLSSPELTAAVHPDAQGQRVSWTLTPTTLEKLLSSDEQAKPHLIVMGNSIVGDYEEYFSRIPVSGTERHELSHTHANASCAYNVEHNRVLQSADHDRLALAFFAAHKFYAFPLMSGTPESEFVEGCMDAFDESQSVASSELKDLSIKESWHKSSEEVDALGAGHGNMRVFNIQHMALETKARIAKIVESAERDEYLLPLCAKQRV